MNKKDTKKSGHGAHDDKQRLFIDYLSDPDNVESPAAFSRRAGIPLETLNAWKADPVIVQAAFQKCVTRLGAEIPKVLKMLLQKALEDKDISACKLFFQQIEKVSETPETGLTVDEALDMIDKAVRQVEVGGTGEDDGKDGE